MAAPAPATPQILIVDDDEMVLKALERVLRGRPWQVNFFSDPREALASVPVNDYWVVLSDYRMPHINGAELLEKIRHLSPTTSRLMLTGFLESSVIEDAVNRGSIFRFLTKPWTDGELNLALERAVENALRRRTHSELAHAIGIQNQKLEELTASLETEVIKRTQGIEESRRLAESRERRVKELTGFVKSLSRVNDVAELYEILQEELQKFQGMSVPYLVVTHRNGTGRLFWLQSRTLHEKILEFLPDHFKSLRVRVSYFDDRKWWQETVRKDCKDLVAIPIRAREAGLAFPAAILFVEHRLGQKDLDEFLERLLERLQPVSIVLDKILLREQMVSAAKQWEGTFDRLKDPIAIVDGADHLIRANSRFRQTPHLPAEFTDHEEEIAPWTQPDGKVFRIRRYPVSNRRAINYFHDITRERDLYLRLVQSEKLAAVGLLAGNIAHELNNPISGIKALAQILKKELSEQNPLWNDLTEIEKASVRCHRIIKNLLSFSEPAESLQAEELSLNDLIEMTLPLLKTALRNQNLQSYLNPGLPKISVRPGELQQVIFNLINNACQAMPDGGTLMVKTWNEGRWVCFSVHDTGPGISESVKPRIFEPFFTTKQKGVGTGLGLSVSKSIVERFGGTIEFSSQASQGTTFVVKLPRLG